MTADDEPGPERLQQSHDFSSLQGLQVVGEGPWTRVDGEESALEREALRLELEARAARFHQAVDASIVLANDGIVRWLGDPIAKLAPGPDLLSPSALILADSRLPEEARQTVATRVELWLAALTRRLLGPLFSLRDLQEGSESVRDLAVKVANALGVLERDPVRSQVKAFDQNSRAALRKHGVRFGAYYIYVPTVLKPAARALALQLWGLQTPGVDFGRVDAIACADGVFGQDVAAHRPANRQGRLSSVGLSPVRRSGRAGRHRGAPCRHDPGCVHSAGRGITSRSERVCRQWPNDVSDRMLRGSVLVGPALAWV